MTTDEFKVWFKSWSGRLAAVAALFSSVVAAFPSDAAFAALSFLPEGPLRLLVAATVFAGVWLLPMLAKRKDDAGG